MESVNKNSSIMKIIFAILSIGFVYIFNLFPQINDGFELVALPEENYFRFFIIFILILNLGFYYILEKWKNIFCLYETNESNNNKKKRDLYYYYY